MQTQGLGSERIDRVRLRVNASLWYPDLVNLAYLLGRHVIEPHRLVERYPHQLQFWERLDRWECLYWNHSRRMAEHRARRQYRDHRE